MIKEISIAGLNNDPIKVKKPNIPQSDNKDSPSFFKYVISSTKAFWKNIFTG